MGDLMLENVKLREQLQELTESLKDFMEATKVKDRQIAELLAELRKSKMDSKPDKNAYCALNPAEEPNARAPVETMETLEEEFQIVKRKRRRAAAESEASKEVASIPGNKHQSGTQDLAADPETKIPNKKERVPPLVVHSNKKDDAMRNLMEDQSFKIRTVSMKPQGLQFITESVEDFKKLREACDKRKLPYHHYSLEEDKEIKVVLKNMPTFLEEETIKADLEKQGFKINSVKRMKSGKTPLSMVLVNAPNTKEG